MGNREEGLNWGTFFALFLILLGGAALAVASFVTVLEISLIYDRGISNPFTDDLYNRLQKVSLSFYKINLYAEYYGLIAEIVWQAWVIAGLVMMFALWGMVAYVKSQTRRLLSSQIYRLKHNLEKEVRMRRSVQDRLEDVDKNIMNAYEQSSESFVLVDENLMIRYLNDAASRQFNAWAEGVRTMLGMQIGDAIPFLRTTNMYPALEEAASHQKPWEGEVFVKQNSSWVSCRLFPGAEGIFILMRDITHQKQSVDLLKVSEVLLQQTVSHVPVALALVDAEWKYLMTSATWGPQFKIKTADLKGLKHTEVMPDFPHNLTVLEQRLKGGESMKGQEEEFTIQGEQEWLNWEVHPWRDTYGNVGGYIMVAEVVTEKVQEKNQIETERKQAKMLAYHDTLTGLPNRQLFNDRLNMALAHAYRQLGKVSLMFLDLDGFKAVNDNLGHDAGDLLLKQVSSRLKECVRQTDTVARLGGDEFTIVLNGVGTREDVDMVAKKIIERVSEPYDLNGKEANISTSIGISLYPEFTSSAVDMVKQADEAMYVAKHSGKNDFRYFDQVTSKIKPEEEQKQTSAQEEQPEVPTT